ncbi:thiamine pyrophosphate-binding protein [Mesorhizobium sp. M1399]|uniref:thiamine pyrophosphate-binding protein n=1 Tax=Mesorhizobium sp. M1399 TaxID=2957096 RepID=UPI0033350329
MTVGERIVDTSIAHKIDSVFCVPSGSYLGLLYDALYGRSDVDNVVWRHESGAGLE